MMHVKKPSELRLALLQWVILPVFILRALIPVGFMPDFTRGEEGGIVICSGYAEDFSSKQSPSHPGKDQPCSFSGIANGLMPDRIVLTAADTAAHGPVVDVRIPVRTHLSHGYQTRAPPIA